MVDETTAPTKERNNMPVPHKVSEFPMNKGTNKGKTMSVSVEKAPGTLGSNPKMNVKSDKVKTDSPTAQVV